MHAVSILVHSPGKRPHAMARLPPGTSHLEAVMYSVILFFYFFLFKQIFFQLLVYCQNRKQSALEAAVFTSCE